MEIREVTQYHKDAPFTGYGIWIIFEQKYRKANLLHPIHLTELVLSEYEIVKSCGKTLWPINDSGSHFNFEKWKQDFNDRVIYFIQHKRTFPVQTVCKVLAEINGTTVQEAIRFLGDQTQSEAGKPVPILFNKANREYALRKDIDLSEYRGRKLALLTAFSENGPASIYQITHLVDGKLRTKCKLSRAVVFLVNKLTSEGILEIVS